MNRRTLLKAFSVMALASVLKGRAPVLEALTKPTRTDKTETDFIAAMQAMGDKPAPMVFVAHSADRQIFGDRPDIQYMDELPP